MSDAWDPSLFRTPETTAERLWKLLREMEQERDEALAAAAKAEKDRLEFIDRMFPEPKHFVWLLQFDGNLPQPVLVFRSKASAHLYARNVEAPFGGHWIPVEVTEDRIEWECSSDGHIYLMWISKVEVFE